MAKYLIFVSVLLCMLLTAQCLFSGESCTGDDQSGTCTLLSECLPLIAEMKKAGSPLPQFMRKKLQKLTCGFEGSEPLVCCVTETSGTDETPMRPVDQTPNRWKPLPNNQGSNNIQPNPLLIDTTNQFPSRPDRDDDIQNHRNFYLLPSECGIFDSDRIWGGNRTRLFEMPWMVLLAYDTDRGRELNCGGTLITEWYVLTAAHCVTFLSKRLRLRGVVLGEHDVRRDPDCEVVETKKFCAPNIRTVSIEEAIAHPGYRPQTLFDDIALLRLAEPADFSLDSMKSICLPFTQELQTQNLTGVQGVVAGWGATEDGLRSPVLLSVDLPIISNENCLKAYNGTIQLSDGQLCAGGVVNKDSCGGDSGGPLTYSAVAGSLGLRYVQRGIVSFGSKRCGIGGFPAVYTRVGNYMQWILDNMRP